VVSKGEFIYKSPALDKIRAFARRNLSALPRGLTEVYPKYKYPVLISPQLRKLKNRLSCRAGRKKSKQKALLSLGQF
jgi:hypothetical protein